MPKQKLLKKELPTQFKSEEEAQAYTDAMEVTENAVLGALAGNFVAMYAL